MPITYRYAGKRDWEMKSQFLLVTLVFLILVLSRADEEIKVEQTTQKESRHSLCLSTEQVHCLLNRNCTGGFQDNEFPLASLELHIGRVRFPGTASSNERRLFREYEVDKKLRYQELPLIAGCESQRLCFSTGDNLSLDLAFRPLSLSGTMNGHIPYDVVMSNMRNEINRKTAQIPNNDNAATNTPNKTLLLTTLRDPGSYAVKWYNMKNAWDRTSGFLENASFAEWIDLAPWRNNFVTRCLGAQADRRSMPKVQMLQPLPGDASEKDEVFLKDEYMKEQNQLGPEKSEVFKLALDRLENGFVHFGLFHRLRDSWDLLAHRFCWHVGERDIYPGKDLRGVDALAEFLNGEEDARGQAEELWSLLRERNRLDIALLDAANKLMDERMAEMRFEKASGVICNFLGKVKVSCDVGTAAVVEEL